jgi:hypothetical protein
VFPVKKIQIQGQMKRVTPEQLRFIAEHELTGTFFTLDIDKTRAAFGKLPWVRDAQVRRRWPDALEIAVEEHVALARWGENGLVDSHGDRFDAASDQQLPVFYGPAGAEKDMTAMLARLRQGLKPTGLAPRTSGCRHVGPGRWAGQRHQAGSGSWRRGFAGGAIRPVLERQAGSAAVPHRLRGHALPQWICRADA